jgi:hypothetical protein
MSILIPIEPINGVEDDTLAFMLQLYLEALHLHRDVDWVEVQEQIHNSQPLTPDELKNISKTMDIWVENSDAVEYLWSTPRRISITCTVNNSKCGYMTIRFMEGKLPNVTNPS